MGSCVEHSYAFFITTFYSLTKAESLCTKNMYNKRTKSNFKKLAILPLTGLVTVLKGAQA
jgi:hypothetical protein